MNITEEIYWKNADGSTVLMKDMTEEQLNKANILIQKRQSQAIGTLELNFKLEQALLTAAKNKKINLKSLENGDANPYAVRRYTEGKEIIKTVERKLKIISNGKRKEALLQATN